MSLVAYDSSDEGSENEENESTVTANGTDKDVNEEPVTIVQTSSRLSLPAPKVSQSLNDEEEEEEEEENEDTGDFKNFLDALPEPSSSHFAGNIEEDDDIILKKETERQAAKPIKQKIKIAVPSLSEFKDLEEESEKKPVRVMQPSERGCGLFNLLVPPKEETMKNKTLIPHAVKKNAVTKTNIQHAKTAKNSNINQMNDSMIKKLTIDKSHNELDSDEEEDTAVDFFGLTASKNIPDSSVELDPKLPLDDLTSKSLKHGNMEDHTIQNSSSSSSDVLANSQLNKTLTSNVMNLPKEEILLKNKAEVGPKLPVPEQEYNIDTEGNVAFDEKAIEYLCGRRGIKRKDKEMDEANIIEINGEDIKPDEREWLVKALTEEPVQRPISMQSCGINSQSKKKHQITYLAHQAKAMELELKNQWAQNRMARKQAKSKYGF